VASSSEAVPKRTRTTPEQHSNNKNRNNMKRVKTRSLLILLIGGMAALTSCSKDDGARPSETFDIRQLEGHYLYVRQSNLDGSVPGFMLMEFMGGQILKLSAVSEDRNIPYTIVNTNTIEILDSVRIVFERDSIWSTLELLTEFALIKAPESDQLAGKTFTGTYYHADKSVLHQNFYYRFAAGGNTFDAGFNLGTVERTESYTPINPIAARATLDNGDTEFMIWVNGQLKVNYKVYSPESTWPDFHGFFTRQ